MEIMHKLQNITGTSIGAGTGTGIGDRDADYHIMANGLVILR